MLKRIVCTTCGSSLEASADESVKKCDSCGNTFLVTDGEEFSGKSEKEISSIKKLRANLKNSIKADDHKNILHFSKEINFSNVNFEYNKNNAMLELNNFSNFKQENTN
mgnify:CR=1 FL=1